MKCDKIAYTERAATKMLKTARNKRRETNGKHKHNVRQKYLCSQCGMYHLTSTKLTKEELDKRANESRINRLAEQFCKQNKWEC